MAELDKSGVIGKGLQKAVSSLVLARVTGKKSSNNIRLKACQTRN